MERVLTARGRATRDRIIAETGERILAAGIGGTTLDSIRAATLTSKSQLFHYFPGGKAELVREVARWEWEQLEAAQEPYIDELSDWDSWQAWRDALMRYYLDRGRWACAIGSIASQAAYEDAALADDIRAIFADWGGRLEAGVRRTQESGAIDPAADPRMLAAALLAAIQGGLLLSQSARSSWPLEAALTTLLGALRHTSAVEV